MRSVSKEVVTGDMVNHTWKDFVMVWNSADLSVTEDIFDHIGDSIVVALDKLQAVAESIREYDN